MGRLERDVKALNGLRRLCSNQLKRKDIHRGAQDTITVDTNTFDLSFLLVGGSPFCLDFFVRGKVIWSAGVGTVNTL